MFLHRIIPENIVLPAYKFRMDNQQKIVIYFDSDEDGTGELFVEANSNNFAGNSSAWFNKTELLDFANALTVYPLAENNLPKLASGFWRSNVKGELKEEHLVISVYPIDGVGNLGVQVKLATQRWSEMCPESQHLVRLEITTNYNALETFSKELVVLINGRVENATLQNV